MVIVYYHRKFREQGALQVMVLCLSDSTLTVSTLTKDLFQSHRFLNLLRPKSLVSVSQFIQVAMQIFCYIINL